jgi:hypothetical protein
MLGPLLALRNGIYWRLTIQKVIDIHAIDYNLAPTVFTKVREDEVALPTTSDSWPESESVYCIMITHTR